MDLLKSILIAIVEGLTEYLPISSTAHMGFAANMMGMEETEFLKMFQVSIQFGAILSVVVAYWKKFFDLNNLQLYVKLAFAVIPALILGYLFDDKIEAVLGNQIAISSALVFGGVVLLFADSWFKNPKIEDEKQMPIKTAVAIGFWQCLAIILVPAAPQHLLLGGWCRALPERRLQSSLSFWQFLQCLLLPFIRFL